MATQVVELTGDEAALLRSLQKVIDKEREHERQLERVGNVGTNVGADVETALLRVEKANTKAIQQSITELGRLGPEGKEAAERLKAEFTKMGKDGFQSVDGVLDDLAKIDPLAAQAAAKIRVELSEADAATRLDNTLSELRKLSPEAAKAADKVRSEMSLADRQVKFDGIIAELKKVDPAAAAEAGKLRNTLETPVQAATSSWAEFAKSTVVKIGAVAGAYVGVQQGVQLVNQYLEEQNALLDKSLQSQLSLGKAQQEAAKNLASFSLVQQNRVLTEAVPQIAMQAGVGDTVAITNALGGVASAGATEEQAISAVTASALLNRLTPDKIADTASAAIDIGKATGSSDARDNLALLLSTGTQARIENPALLANSLSVALSNAVTTVPGQSKEDATREAAAIFATLTQASTDKTGDTSKTATLDLTTQLSKFFGDFEAQQRNARSELSKLDPKIADGKATESEIFNAQQLRAFLEQASNVQDPGTLFGRIETLQDNTAIRDQFFSTEFGQIQFKQAFRLLADSSSEMAQQLEAAKSKIEVDSSGFERILDVTTSLTPQLRVANFVAGQAASAEVTDAFSTERASLQAVRKNVSNVLGRTRESGFGGFLGSFADENTISNSLGGDTFAEESVFGISRLRGRLRNLQRGGLTDEEKPKALELEQEITRLTGFLQQQTQAGGISESSIEAAAESALSMSRNLRQTGVSASGQGGRLSARDAEDARYFESIAESLRQSLEVARRQNELVAEQNELLRETADNTAPVGPDVAAVSAAAMVQEDSQ